MASKPTGLAAFTQKSAPAPSEEQQKIPEPRRNFDRAIVTRGLGEIAPARRLRGHQYSTTGRHRAVHGFRIERTAGP
jgi:hypothetical protein